MSSRAGHRPYLIERRDQLATLQSAVRQEILDTIQAAGPRSAAEIGELMGRPPDALYYHLKRLLAVELLTVREIRWTGRREAAVYDLVGHPLVLQYPMGRRGGHPLPGLVRAMVATAERDFRAAVGSERAATEGATRNLWAGRRHAWLATRDLKRINGLIDELVSIMTRSRNPARGQLCTLTLLLAPRAPRRRRVGTTRAVS